MPLEYGKNKQGSWVRWGNKGKKYYYQEASVRSKAHAESKAEKQAEAIYASGWRDHDIPTGH